MSLEITARAVEIFFYMRVSGTSFQMGVRELVSVNLGVFDMKKFENHCTKEGQNVACLAFFRETSL